MVILYGRPYVALRKESVDRNAKRLKTPCVKLVALRKESVDRNTHRTVNIQSPATVALRKESVDRNAELEEVKHYGKCRSPQGERG